MYACHSFCRLLPVSINSSICASCANAVFSSDLIESCRMRMFFVNSAIDAVFAAMARLFSATIWVNSFVVNVVSSCRMVSGLSIYSSTT